jgi:D-lyxose ketol-isomerase
VSAFTDLGSVPPQRIWDGVLGRTVHGERVTFTLGETRELGPGEAWRITGHLPHSVVSGPEGAVLVEVFSPVRSDWAGLETIEPQPARWPAD